jgi:hypothetical protein
VLDLVKPFDRFHDVAEIVALCLRNLRREAGESDKN